MALFSQRPYDEVSTDDIAHAAGISKGLVYHYFPNKRDFYVASLRLAATRLMAKTAPDPSLPKPMQLYAGLSQYLDYVDGFANSYTALLKGGIGSDVSAAAIVDECREALERRVLDAILPSAVSTSQDPAGASAVTAPPAALRLALRGWIGFVEAASLDWLAHRDLPKESLLQMLVGALATALSGAQALDPSIRLELD